MIKSLHYRNNLDVLDTTRTAISRLHLYEITDEVSVRFNAINVGSLSMVDVDLHESAAYIRICLYNKAE